MSASPGPTDEATRAPGASPRGARVTEAEYILVGTIIGVMSGLFGVGGSSVSTPILRLALGVSPLIAIATPLPVTLPAAVAGGYVYARAGLVQWRVVLISGAAGIPAVTLGALATSVVNGSALLVLTGIFVAIVGVRILLPMPITHHDQHTHASVGLVAGIGAGVGFLSGLLANGGGFLLVPAFILLLGMRAQEAAATSLITVVAYAVPGTAVHWSLGHIDARLMLLLSAGVLPASYIGGRLGLLLPSHVTRMLFGVFLTAFGIFFGVKELVGFIR